MRLRWGEERIKGFSDPITKAEKTNDWALWGLFGVAVIIVVAFILEIMGKI